MAKKIYGVDPEKEVTPAMVRDAIIECFIKAHSEVLEAEYDQSKTKADLEELKEMNVRTMIKEIFKQLKLDFDNPTKEGLVMVINELKKFALRFRDPSIINKRHGEIMTLIDKIK